MTKLILPLLALFTLSACGAPGMPAASTASQAGLKAASYLEPTKEEHQRLAAEVLKSVKAAGQDASEVAYQGLRKLAKSYGNGRLFLYGSMNAAEEMENPENAKRIAIAVCEEIVKTGDVEEKGEVLFVKAEKLVNALQGTDEQYRAARRYIGGWAVDYEVVAGIGHSGLTSKVENIALKAGFDMLPSKPVPSLAVFHQAVAELRAVVAKK